MTYKCPAIEDIDKPVVLSLPHETTCVADDQFTVPCRLYKKESYPPWFYRFVKEMKRVYGPYEYKYFLNYLMDKDPTPQLPKNSEYRAQVKRNVQTLLKQVYQRQILEMVTGSFYFRGDLGSYKDFHETICCYEEGSYKDYLDEWSKTLSKTDDMSRDFEEQLLSNSFDKSELIYMREVGMSYEFSPSSRDLLDWLGNCENVDISLRICEVALQDNIAEKSDSVRSALSAVASRRPRKVNRVKRKSEYDEDVYYTHVIFELFKMMY